MNYVFFFCNYYTMLKCYYIFKIFENVVKSFKFYKDIIKYIEKTK